MTREEIRDGLLKKPVDINGEFKNPIKLVQDDGLFQQCVDFWQGLQSSTQDVSKLCSQLGTEEEVPISSLKSIQYGIKADKVWAILAKPGDENRPVVVVKTKRGLVLLDGNTRAFIRREMDESTVKAYVLRIDKRTETGSKLFETTYSDWQKSREYITTNSDGTRNFDRAKYDNIYKDFRDRSEDHLTKDVLGKGMNRKYLGGYFRHECDEIIEKIRKGELDLDEMEADGTVMDSMRRFDKTKKGDDSRIETKKKGVFSKLFESVLMDNAVFYDMVKAELHDAKGVQIYSDEPLRDNYSCLDYSREGDDRDEDERGEGFDRRFRWDDCTLTMDDDGLYFKSASGKNGCVTIYAIMKAELKPNRVVIWVGPKDSSEEMAVVSFYTEEKRDPRHT